MDLQEAYKKPEVFLKFKQTLELASRPLQTPKDLFYGRLSEVTIWYINLLPLL